MFWIELPNLNLLRGFIETIYEQFVARLELRWMIYTVVRGIEQKFGIVRMVIQKNLEWYTF